MCVRGVLDHPDNSAARWPFLRMIAAVIMEGGVDKRQRRGLAFVYKSPGRPSTATESTEIRESTLQMNDGGQTKKHTAGSGGTNNSAAKRISKNLGNHKQLLSPIHPHQPATMVKARLSLKTSSRNKPESHTEDSPRNRHAGAR